MVSVSEGLKLALENGMDLVEVAAQSKPPVCRVMDFSKYKYEQAKKEREAKKKQRAFHVKEIKFKPNIEEHDYMVKLKALEKFLKRGDRAKVTMTFRGREMAHIDLGRKVLDRLIEDLKLIGEIDKPPVQEGRNIIMVFMPK